jgi:zinc protease
MKKISMVTLAALVGVSCSSGSRHSDANTTTRGVGVAKELQLPNYEEVTLSNGLKVIYVQDKKLPYVSYTVLFRVGAIHDPVESPGLTYLTVRMLDKGTRWKNARQISDRLAQMAAPVSLATSHESSTVAASTLSRFEDQLLLELKEMLLQPAFQKDELERLKEQVIAEVKRAQDQPAQLANMEFEPFLFMGHPYGQRVLGTPESIKAITEADIRRHYQQWFGPGNAYFAVVGNYAKDIPEKVRRQLQTWKPSQLSSEVNIPPWMMSKNETKVLERPGLTQAEIRIGMQGLPRKHPDYLPLRLANSVFGESMGSRLMSRLRVDLGLTYGVYSAWDYRVKGGSFNVSFSTRSEKVDVAIDEVKRLLADFQKRGITKPELERAKAQMRGAFPMVIETPEKLTAQLLLLRVFGVPDTYLTTFNSQIDKISLGDVNAAIARNVDPEKIRILIVK